jgi:hypothetical protein
MAFTLLAAGAVGAAQGATRSWKVRGDQVSAFFGYSVATAGDVNGDGFEDVIVGADQYDHGQNNEGRAYVYIGSASGLVTTAAWTAEVDHGSALFGYSVATAGDVNRDGFDDVIIGAPYYTNSLRNEGQAFVYQGSPSGLGATPAWTAAGNQVSAFFGRSVASAGDVNGDGFSDVIVGATAYDNGQDNEGRSFVYHGSASGLGTTPAWTTESDQAGALLGDSVATAGDVNGDGFDDVIVAAEEYDQGQTDEGAAFVYQGSISGLSTDPAWMAQSDQAGSLFGESAATAGDVNGDGFSDVIVGAPDFDHGFDLEGRTFVYHGSASGLGSVPAWTAEGNEDFGNSVASAGDVNGDGFSDVIVGNRYFDHGEFNDEGRAALFEGSAIGLGDAPAWTQEGLQDSAFFSNSVGSAGDVNGDGFSDMIVGALGYDVGQFSVGIAVVFAGGPALR